MRIDINYTNEPVGSQKISGSSSFTTAHGYIIEVLEPTIISSISLFIRTTALGTSTIVPYAAKYNTEKRMFNLQKKHGNHFDFGYSNDLVLREIPFDTILEPGKWLIGFKLSPNVVHEVGTAKWGDNRVENTLTSNPYFEFSNDNVFVATNYNNTSATGIIPKEFFIGDVHYRDNHQLQVYNRTESYKVYLGIDAKGANQSPTLTLNTSNNQTLYENDTLIIDGSAIDNDADQSVTVYYQINDGPKKVLATNLSQTTIPFNKQLKFKNGKLYDGETAVSGNLTDGVAHTLKVWAQDSEGAESTVAMRTFYVVPNRAPTLTINEVVPSGNIDTDKFTVSGHAGDPDANANVTVTYRINENNSIQVYEGPGGAFSFDIALGQLVVGQNTIVVEVIDNYGAKISKTIKLNKNEIETPLLKSTARYKLEPPSGSAKGVLLYIRRDQNLAIDTKISMTLKGEPENFVPMPKTNTAPIPNDSKILEDEFYYETTEPKDNIIVQVDMERDSFDVSDTITLIQGVFE